MRLTRVVALLSAGAALITSAAATGARERGQTRQTERGAEAGQRLMVFDRRGRLVTTVGAVGIYNQPAFSPDGSRLAVVKTDPATQHQDIWTFDLHTGAGVQRTFDSAPDSGPAWSPDGREIAFASYRDRVWELRQVASAGDPHQELLYRHLGFGGISNPAWLPNGGGLSFSDLINISGAMYVLPLDAPSRAPVEVLRPPPLGARISPDTRFVAFASSLSGTSEIYVRPFDVAAAEGPFQHEEARQVSRGGGVGNIFWRRDSQELYYLGAHSEVMAAAVVASPMPRAGTPRRLFRASNPRAAVRIGAVSDDGEHFVLTEPPPPPTRQLAVVEREGRILRTIGKPGTYGEPAISPDGRHAAVVHIDSFTGNQDIWTIDLSNGNARPVTADAAPDMFPVWSPDSRDIAYVSVRGDYTNIYRKSGDGRGHERLVYQNTPGAGGLVLTDWSPDGRSLSFYSADVLSVLRIGERQPEEIARTEFSNVGGRFSPDGGFLAYLSDRSGRYELYVRALRMQSGKPDSSSASEWQISEAGARGMIFWRDDDRELGYLAADGSVQSVEVVSTSPFQTGARKVLFKPARLPTGGPYAAMDNAAQLGNVSRDGRQFVFATDSSAP
jgi:Tol biopolymer transport system component